MKKINKILIQEFAMLDEILKKEYSYREDNYSIYHSQMIDSYEAIKECLYGITNFNQSKEEDFIFYIANAFLSDKQLENILTLRKKPIYIKAIGEAALLHKDYIEKILNCEIHNRGIIFSMNRQAVKITPQLEEEGELLASKIEHLYQEGKLDEKKAEKYRGQLFYIYQYYESIAQGNQIPLQKFSNSFYQKLDKLAQKKRISFANQFNQSLQNLRFQFEDLQRLQEDYYMQNKASIK